MLINQTQNDLNNSKENEKKIKNLSKTQEIHLDQSKINKDITKELEILKYRMGSFFIHNKKANFSWKELVQTYYWKVIFVIISAFVFNFSIQIFLSRGETIPSGWTGIPTLLQILFNEIRPYFALIYLAVNLPLFLIFWKKIKKSFLILTFIFMISQIVANLIFTYEPIFEFITSSINLVPFSNEEIEKLKEKQNFNSYKDIIDSAKELWNEEGKTWPFFVYCAIGAFFVGIAISISWKAGGSTGGTDIIAYYFVTKSKKSIGSILSIFSFISATIFLIIWGVVAPNKGIGLFEYKNLAVKASNSQIFIGVREISTYLYILISTLVVSIIYPKYKKMKMTIVTKDITKVLAYFKLIEYWHGYRIETYKSGFTGKRGYKIETVVLLLETKNLVYDLKTLSSDIWISLSPVSNIVGSFNTKFVDQ
ncbi:YitT family protein [Mycoplasmopsis cricetuli]|uniref:YitT family protein n=1 Tax=Mycoplasmopsis cricetuli TaxID=171283 RepID=UPI00046E86A4|nr:YitT family protein [Mycoplasmopsis cricetuli]